MIIKDPDKDYGLAQAEYEGDQFKFTHVQNVDNAIEELKMHEANQSSDGWTADRSMRYLGTIPDIIWLKHPEWQDNPQLIEKWLATEEGRKWCVNLPDTGKSGNTIVK